MKQFESLGKILSRQEQKNILGGIGDMRIFFCYDYQEHFVGSTCANSGAVNPCLSCWGQAIFSVQTGTTCVSPNCNPNS